MKKTKAKSATKSPSSAATVSKSIDESKSDYLCQYRDMCQRRYFEALRKYNAQFLLELKVQVALQRSAFKGAKLHKNFCNPILRRVDKEDVIQLTQDEKRRIEELLKEDTFKCWR